MEGFPTDPGRGAGGFWIASYMEEVMTSRGFMVLGLVFLVPGSTFESLVPGCRKRSAKPNQRLITSRREQKDSHTLDHSGRVGRFVNFHVCYVSTLFRAFIV